FFISRRGHTSFSRDWSSDVLLFRSRLPAPQRPSSSADDQKFACVRPLAQSGMSWIASRVVPRFGSAPKRVAHTTGIRQSQIMPAQHNRYLKSLAHTRKTGEPPGPAGEPGGWPQPVVRGRGSGPVADREDHALPGLLDVLPHLVAGQQLAERADRRVLGVLGPDHQSVGVVLDVLGGVAGLPGQFVGGL